MASEADADADAPSLAALPPEVLLRVLRHAGAPAVAAAACTCTRFRALQAELAEVPCFASALVRITRAGSAPTAHAAAAAAARQAAERMVSAVDFAVVLVAPAGGTPPRASLAAALDAVKARLPRCAVALGVTDVHNGVCVLLGRVPGCVVTLSRRGEYPRLVGAVAPADARLAAWLNAPPGGTHAPVWCAHFLSGTGVRPFEATPHLARAWPGMALVGGIASARSGHGAVATSAFGAQRLDAAALAIFAPLAATSPAVRGAAAAVRGLTPCGAVWAVDELIDAEPDSDEEDDDKTVDPAGAVPLLLTSGRPVAPAFPDGSLSVWHDAFVGAFEQHGVVFVRLWPGAPPHADAAAAAAEREARATARALAAEPHMGDVARNKVLLWAPRDALRPEDRVALAQGRLRCQVLRTDAAPAAQDAVQTAQRLATAMTRDTAPGRGHGVGAAAAVLAAACSARGMHLFEREGEEARALAAAFPHAFAGVTVNGELGPPPECDTAPAVLQSYTTTLAALGA